MKEKAIDKLEKSYFRYKKIRKENLSLGLGDKQIAEATTETLFDQRLSACLEGTR